MTGRGPITLADVADETEDTVDDEICIECGQPMDDHCGDCKGVE
jgi:hypothetical protein